MNEKVKKFLVLFTVLFLFILVVGCSSEKEKAEEALEQVLEMQDEMMEQVESVVEAADDLVSDDDDEVELDESEELDEEEAYEGTISYQLSDSELEVLKTRLSVTTAATLSRPKIMDLDVGDIFVAGIGIRNTEMKTLDDITININFQKAETASRSRIDEVDETVEDWFSINIYEPFSLDKGEEAYLPLIIKVGDVIGSNGDELVPGDYLFDIDVVYDDDGFETIHQELVLTVQIS